MRNSAYEARHGGVPNLSEVLQHPLFANGMRLFLVAILALGGYIWKTELAHLNQAMESIRTDVQENVQRQWSELQSVRGDVSRLNREVYGVLYRTNDLLSRLALPDTPIPKGRTAR